MSHLILSNQDNENEQTRNFLPQLNPINVLPMISNTTECASLVRNKKMPLTIAIRLFAISVFFLKNKKNSAMRNKVKNEDYNFIELYNSVET